MLASTVLGTLRRNPVSESMKEPVMYKSRVLVCLLSFAFTASLCQAQSTVLDLPRQSQHAIVEQRLGITDITINYHRPLAKGRKIWGGIGDSEPLFDNGMLAHNGSE